MQTSQWVRIFARHTDERLDRSGSLLCEGELRLLSNAHVRMGKQCGQFLERTALHAFSDEPPRLSNDLTLVHLRVMHAIEAPLAGSLPALHPIGDIKTPVHAELAVGGEDSPDEVAR